MRRGRRNARCTTPKPVRRSAVLTSPRTIVVAGAGIGGLTAALALARNGFRAVVLEQAERLEETGAGIQLSPNAARTLIDLGLESRLKPYAVAPVALRVLDGVSGREMVRVPLGETVAQRYGAPYWTLHRGDLQAALAAAAAAQRGISVKLGMRVEDFVAHPNGLTVSARGRGGLSDEHGVALIGADGLWSLVRMRIGDRRAPRFAGRTAWRALVPAKEVTPEFREPVVHLWLGRNAHLVHYPVKAGRVINIVVIAAGDWSGPGWSEPAGRAELIPRLAAADWAPQPLTLVNLPEAWLKWALFERRPPWRWSRGPVALLGDAAHPVLPYLAQGAALAIEDAAVVAQCLAQMPHDAAAALKTYAALRRARAWKVQRAAARNGARYHRSGAARLLRDAAMRTIGGTRLLAHYDWLYDWRPPAVFSIT
jgi:salicylate hydroxylase